MGDNDLKSARFRPMAIGDLIVLTLCVACVFGSVSPEFREALKSSSVTGWQIAAWIMDCFAIGVSLFGMVVLFREKARGGAWLWSPGHWLLVAFGPIAVHGLARMYYGPLALKFVFADQRLFVAASNTLTIALIVVSVLLSARGLQVAEFRWRMCLLLAQAWLVATGIFLAIIAFNVTGIRVGNFWSRPLLAIATSSILAAAALSLVAIATDLLRQCSRDWLHYVGISALEFHALNAMLQFGGYAVKWWRELLLHLLP